eukprot:2369070-Amphidinium_carterae.2
MHTACHEDTHVHKIGSVEKVAIMMMGCERCLSADKRLRVVVACPHIVTKSTLTVLCQFTTLITTTPCVDSNINAVRLPQAQTPDLLLPRAGLQNFAVGARPLTPKLIEIHTH